MRVAPSSRVSVAPEARRLARSLAFGARTPWKQTRCSHGVSSLNSTCPAALSCTAEPVGRLESATFASLFDRSMASSGRDNGHTIPPGGDVPFSIVRMRSIKGLLLTAGLVFSVGLSLSVYGVVSALGERSVREEAVEGATGLADLTFATMFELMRTGWSRAQLEAFVAATQKSMGAGTRQIDIHRGEKVSALFGPIAQKPADEAMGRAIAERRTQRIDEGDVVRVVQPLLAEPVCLKCHTNTATGDVLGVIDVRQDVGPRIAAQGERLRIAFAPIVPIALAATLAMVLFIRRRLKRSIDSLASSLLTAPMLEASESIERFSRRPARAGGEGREGRLSRVRRGGQ